MRKPSLLIALFSLCISMLPSCAGVPKNERLIKKVIINNLHIRRPNGPGADPSSGPGGLDYHAQPLPNERLDCEKAENLLKDFNLTPLRECLQSIKQTTTVSYRIIRAHVPFMELQKTETTPACLVTLLPKIPTPRELVFQSQDESAEQDEPFCYSTRLNIEADEMLGEKMPKAKVDLQLRFPLSADDIANDEQLFRLLQSWALTPHWNQEAGGFKSKIIPHTICVRCMGEKNIFKKTGLVVPVFWP